MSLEVKNLIKSYGSQQAVDNISFNVNKGEIAGFLGPNGAGKSTTMKIITGYLQPDGGDVLVSGIDIRLNPLAAKSKVGYLPEANPLYYDMYVKEYLGFMAGVHQIPHKQERIAHVIEITGLSLESRKRTCELSKGYKQRVGLAAALIHDPEVLILDEPTTGLDPNQIIEIRELIRELGKDKTVLFSSHILQEVEAVCDRVVIINRGKLVADDHLSNLQVTGQSHHTVSVHFKEPVSPQLISSIGPALSITPQGVDGWRIETSEPEQVRRQLLELSLQHNLNIVSLQSESNNLEAIFRSLTLNT